VLITPSARTFFRIYSDRVRLVVVDEPSAAMDPAGEYELFKHLREARASKTMVFITHRFGHLTKHADIILYVSREDFMAQADRGAGA
jgi:energy-coupling factor transporter ATP-binding protein EcfA2